MTSLNWDNATMAELLARQGHLEKAVWTYRRVLLRGGAEPEAFDRWSELEKEWADKRGGKMNFKEQMQHLVDNVPGALSASIMGYDGIPIEEYTAPSTDIDVATILTEYSALTTQLVKSDIESAGPMSDVTLAAESVRAVLRPINEDCFLAMMVGAGGLTGKARFLMRIAAPKLSTELS